MKITNKKDIQNAKVKLSTKRVSCGRSVSSRLKIRHEKDKVNTFDPKLFREKLEAKQ